MTLRGAAVALTRTTAVLLLAAAALSDFLSTTRPEVQNLEMFYAPPARIRFLDSEGRLHWRPFVYSRELTDPLEARYEERKDRICTLEFFVEGYPYRLFGLLPVNRHLIGTQTGEAIYPLGTDELGRDVLARALAGARTSLLVTLLGIFIYALLGTAVGAVAGWQGGWLDSALMRISEFVLALPALYLLLALRALLPVRLPYWQALLLTVGTIACVAWPPLAKGVRGLVLQLRSAGYVEAARGLGANGRQIFVRHMLPSLAPYALSQTLIAAPVFIMGEVVLSFLDVGLSATGSSWGAMLKNLKDPRVLTDFWWNLTPLLFIFATLFCLNTLGTQGKRELQRTML